MFELIKANKRRSALLIFCFVVLLSLVGAGFGILFGAGPVGAIVALVFSGAMAFASYWKADSIALAVSRAKPADPQQYQRLHNLVEGLCIAGGLPKPRVFIVRSKSQARSDCSYHRSAREDEPSRARGSDRPRVVARAQL
jgi:heat shock protein HtpX